MNHAAPDQISGSMDLLEEAAGRTKTHLDRRGLAEMNELLDAIVAEHPSMALRLNLVAHMREASSKGREKALRVLDRFLADVVQGRVRAAAALAELTQSQGWKRVMTYSRSGQVLECLAAARAAGLESVVLSEARPAGEGIIMAKELRGEGFDVTLTTDAALVAFLPSVQAVVVGVDACFGEAFANKTGTAALLREARAMGVSTVALMVPEKHLDHPIADLWRNLPLNRPARLGKLPKGVSWRGSLFELVPWELVTHPIC